MQPRIETLSEKKLVGKRVTMSLADNKVAELWKGFMSKRQEITNNLSNDLISLAVYPPGHFSDFKPTNWFEKWAAVEVSELDHVPPGMDSLVLTGGLYAVFDYKGLSTDTSIYQHIYDSWLPGSSYHLGNRPHFEILGEKYKNNHPESEEEIWIPIEAG